MSSPAPNMKVFWTCFIALIATAFGFIVRMNLLGTWATEFNLSETQKGQILGVGLWPFAISIVLFSLIIDKIGYKVSLFIAFICHAAYMAIIIATKTIAADPSSPTGFDPQKGYWMLYIGSFIGALGNGTVEAVINPVVATMFNKNKTKWLNILHAGWPGGLVLAGILAIAIGDVDWRMKVGLVGLPVVLYGFLLFGCQFPVNERVTAGVSFRDMLKEVGFFGALLVSTLIVLEVSNVLENANVIFQKEAGAEVNKFDAVVWSAKVPVLETVELTLKQAYKFGIAGGIALLFGLYTLSLGRFLFIVLMFIMMPLAITELGVDSWSEELMKPEMKKLGEKLGIVGGLQGGWVLVYTSAIMMVLRFFAGPIIRTLTPLGLLAISSALAAGGLLFLGNATGPLILAAATMYGIGKTFFWPTMLGLASEQSPKGGALTLNALGGLGMMAVGIIGAPLLGNVQDKEVDKQLAAHHATLHGSIMGEEKTSVFGKYKAIDPAKLTAETAKEKAAVEKLPTDKQPEKLIPQVVEDTKGDAKKSALNTVAIFPMVMFGCYVLLILYFYLRGGYKPVSLPGQGPAPSAH